MLLDRVPGQHFDALLDHADGRRGRSFSERLEGKRCHRGPRLGSNQEGIMWQLGMKGLFILGLMLSSPITLIAQERAANPVVPNATLGPFQHGTFPSLESRGQQWTHVGVDLVAPGGSPIYAFGDGTVTQVITKDDPEFSWAGNPVMIEHPTKPRSIYTIYLHLKEAPSVKAADSVQGGKTQIGKVGRTGAASNVDHVHFEIRYFKEWLSRWGNIYAPGDQRNSPYLKANWEDPLVYFLRFSSGLRLEQKRTEVSTAQAEKSGGQRTGTGPSEVVAGSVSGKTAISGKVLDSFNRPLVGASVTIEKTTFKATTDANGDYRIGYVPGTVALVVSMPGYTDVTLDLNLRPRLLTENQHLT